MEPNKNVVMWLVLFPPLGVIRIWTLSTWSKKVKILITMGMILLFLATVLISVYPVWYINHMF